jgi:hypothetical protein
LNEVDCSDAFHNLQCSYDQNSGIETVGFTSNPTFASVNSTTVYSQFCTCGNLQVGSNGTVLIRVIDPNNNVVASPNPILTQANVTFSTTPTYSSVTVTGNANVSGILSGNVATPVTRSLISKLRDIVSVKDYGAKCDGTTDDAASIQACISAVGTAQGGGTIVFPPGTCIIGSTLSITEPQVVLKGAGGLSISTLDTPPAPPTGGTLLSWRGAPGFPMLSVRPMDSPSGNFLTGNGVLDLGLLCNGAAGIGLYVSGAWSGEYDIYAQNCTTALMQMDANAQLAVQTGCQTNVVRLTGTQPAGSMGDGLLMTGNATAVNGQGAVTAGDAASNIIEVVDVLVDYGSAVNCQFADHNDFYFVRALASSSPSHGTGVLLSAQNGGAFCSYNRIHYLATNLVRSVWSQANGTAPATSNHLLYLMKNGSPPTIDSGSTLFWGSVDGIWSSWNFANVLVGGNYGTVFAALPFKGTESLRIVSSSSNQLVLSDYTNAYNWTIAIVGNGSASGYPDDLLFISPSNASAYWNLQNPSSMVTPCVRGPLGRRTSMRNALLGTESDVVYNANAQHYTMVASGGINSALGTDASGNVLINAGIQSQPSWKVVYVNNTANYWQTSPSTAGNGPLLQATGLNANIVGIFTARGTGGYSFQAISSGVLFVISPLVGTAANHLNVQASTSGSGPSISAIGTDTDINVNIVPKGTGVLSVPAGITATGVLSGQVATPTPRSLISKLQDQVSVKDYGAVCDGVTDDTSAIQAAINATSSANIGTGKALRFPPGVCLVCNLQVYGYARWIGDSYADSIIRAKNCGNSLYLVANTQWLVTGSTSVDAPGEYSDLFFDAVGLKSYAFVARSASQFTQCAFRSALVSNLLVTSKAYDGTDAGPYQFLDPLGYGAFGGRVVESVFGSASPGTNATVPSAPYDMQSTGQQTTDWALINNWFGGGVNCQINLYVENTAGWILLGNHMYEGNNRSLYLGAGIPELVESNYFESGLYVTGYLGGSSGMLVIGPGNTIITKFEAGFTANASLPMNIMSLNNYYGFTSVGGFGSAYLQHDGTLATHILHSKGDILQTSNPFRYANGSTGVGLFYVSNSIAINPAGTRWQNVNGVGSGLARIWLSSVAIYGNYAGTALQNASLSVIVGDDAGGSLVSGVSNVIIGNAADTSGDATNANAIGARAVAATQANALGELAQATGTGSLALGQGTVASANQAIASGIGASATGGNCMARGGFTSCSAGQSIADGYQASASGTKCIAKGASATCSGSNCLAIGDGSSCSQVGAMAFGSLASTGTNGYCIALGYNTTCAAPFELTIGSPVAGQGISTQSTVGAAGGASALPATPSLYLVLRINGVKYVSPLYAAS